jgi:hypothetical protein
LEELENTGCQPGQPGQAALLRDSTLAAPMQCLSEALLGPKWVNN